MIMIKGNVLISLEILLIVKHSNMLHFKGYHNINNKITIIRYSCI